MYRNLDADAIIFTAGALKRRVGERFPERGITRVCADLNLVVSESKIKVVAVKEPLWWLRLLVGAIILSIIALTVFAILNVKLPSGSFIFTDLLQVIEAGINDIILIGAAILFLITLENRVKRNRTLKALHELRALAHVIDMHQLTKDPERLVKTHTRTASSPVNTMTKFELIRYLDYCSEMLSIIGKIAALYTQNFDDPVVLAAVNEIESLTTNLSRKIWQKIVIIKSLESMGDELL